MPLQPGERLGPYEIIAPLGAGGMGEVYSARDTRLGRTVAIKRTLERFSDRFQREARAISTLNHPNVCQLYDVGPDFLVMELVDGSPVAAVDTPRKLLDLATQLADGLASAHAAGVIHRDLKPENILVTRDGRVKILDFGLAVERHAPVGLDQETLAAGRTEPGAIVGTVAYMSPEQARGEVPLTPQSDQFALGLVLYELAAGRRAFRRNSTAETLTAIIREDPDPLPATVPAPLRWVIERLLAKDPADRYDSTRDLYRELRVIRDRLSEGTSGTMAAVEPASVRRRGNRPALLAAAVVAGIVVGAAVASLLPRADTAPAADLSSLTFRPLATEPVLELGPSWAPDGETIAYVADVNARSQIFTRSVGSIDAAQITRGDAGATNPSWSPDGSAIYFNSAGGLWVVGRAGGAPDRVFERAGRHAIHPDGKTIVFLRTGELWVGARGEEPREFPRVAEITGPKRLMGFSPDGAMLAVLEGEQVWLIPFPAGGAPRSYRVPFVENASWMPDSRRLVLTRIFSPELHTMSMLDTVTGDQRAFYASPEAMTSATVSGDGKRLAYVAGRIQWSVVEVNTTDARTRMLSPSGDFSYYPAWTPDGARYVFAKYRGGRWTIDEASSADGLSRRLIDVPNRNIAFVQLAPDGNQLTFVETSQDGDRLMLANLAGQTSPLDPSAPGTTTAAAWSPDSRYITYLRTIAGQRLEVARIRPGSTAAPDILATYPIGDAAQVRVPVAWSPDGSTILTRSGNGAQMFLSSADFTSERPLPSRLCSPVAGFSKDGRAVLGLCQNTGVEGAPWQLWSVDVSTGVERLVGNADMPIAVRQVAGFSLHPDGTRFVTSAGIFPYDIWMLEGFEQP